MAVSNLMLAILAMDAYSQGYRPGLDSDRPQIGSATRIDFPTPASWVDAGFYAAAYKLADGTTVISYRGTDYITETKGVGGDFVNGYGLGAGSPLGTQAALAVEFYNAVKNTAGVTNIVVTGHSLGGGLAGYVGALYGLQGAIFDNMTFNNAAKNAQLWATDAFNGVVPADGNHVLATTAEAQGLLNGIYGGQQPWALDFSKLSAFAVTGELLSIILALRAFQSPSVINVDSNGGLRSPIELHSQALLATLKWAQENQKTDWRSIGPAFIDALFNNQIAQAAGVMDLKGKLIEEGSYAAAEMAAIAYSAVDPSSPAAGKPFGDTAIWSMFDDAGELGSIVTRGAPRFFDDTVKRTPSLLDPLGRTDVEEYIANVLVQYAGALALYDVQEASGGKISTSQGAVDARKGILSGGTGQDALALDMSRVLWGDVLKSNSAATTELSGDKLDPIEQDEFRQTYFKQAEEQGVFPSILRFLHLRSSQWDDASLAKLASEVWGTSDLDIFDRFHIATSDTATNVTLTAREYAPDTSLGDKAQVDVYIGTAADETIDNRTQGHSLIITGDGNDSVSAGDGNDVVFSSGGGDQLDGGDGNDIIVALDGAGAVTAGGAGRDIVINRTTNGYIWGDYAAGADADGALAEDSDANSDLFEFAPNTVIMDAQRHDILRFGGIALTGGDAAAGSVMLALGGSVGGLIGAAGALAAANSAAAALDNPIYVDHLIPFITYRRDGDDLLIGNVFDGFFRALTGQSGVFSLPDGQGGDFDVQGVQRIKNFAEDGGFVSSIWGFQQAYQTLEGLGESGPVGKLDMLFKDGNPYLLPLFLISNLPSVAGSGAFGMVLQALTSLDQALVTMSALVRAARAASWALDDDPLVIDLDGDGIETTGLERSHAWFDLDGDLFRQKTGWLENDDGLLVLDRNGDGRIDDISEMFGRPGGSGFSELRLVDEDASRLAERRHMRRQKNVWRSRLGRAHARKNRGLRKNDARTEGYSTRVAGKSLNRKQSGECGA